MVRKGQRQPSVPYVSFTTFVDTLDWLEQEGLPQRLDASVWRRRYSTAYGLQITTAFRFLGLVSPNDSPTDLLERLVFNRGQRSTILAQVLKSRYAFVEELELSRATPTQIENRFRSLGLEGDTLRKATTFFLHAAAFSGFPLSPFLTRRARVRAAGRRVTSEGDSPSPASGQEATDVNPVLGALLDQARQDGPHWTEEQRRRWLGAWTSAIDLVYPVAE